MKIPKLFYFNIIVFLTILTFVFGIGYFVLHFTEKTFAASTTDAVPPVISNVKIEGITGTSSTITWETNELADSLVNYGLDKSYGIMRDPRADKKQHKIVLENLLEGMTYYFRLTSSDTTGNQGISSDFSFTTSKKPEEQKQEETKTETQTQEQTQEKIEQNKMDKITEEGKGGLYENGTEEIINKIKQLTSEEQLQEVKEQIEKKAEEILAPPTIILDYADVEIGTDYVIITWKTDKESNTVVSLAKESDYKEGAENPYVWHEGNSSEQILEHRVEITGLSPSTIYHFQVSSETELGLKGESTDKTFKTKSIKPEIYNIQIAKVEEDSATIRWTTNIPCSSVVEYTNLNNNETKLEGNSGYLTAHSIKLSNLLFDTYYSAIIKVESEDGEKAESAPMTFITIKDEYPPMISKVSTESTLYPGSENKVQTIVDWTTDEPSQCQLLYHQGIIGSGESEKLTKETDYGLKHVQVATNFLPSTVYKFWIVCDDETGNSGKSEDFTMLTPSQEESIIDIILKNFESSFGWMKKLKVN